MIDFINKINELWWAPGSVAAFLNFVFAYVEKFSFPEEKILGNCLFVKSQIKSKKIKSLEDFINKVKNNFGDIQEVGDTIQETNKNIYISLIDDFERYDSYYQKTDKIRKTIKFIKTSFMIFIGMAFFMLILGFAFPQLRLFLFILSVLVIILTIIFLFIGRKLQSQVDDLLNKPDLISFHQKND